jgi:hypothetical protein
MSLGKVLKYCAVASFFLPVLFLRSNGHNCEWRDCMKICYKGDLGCCVMKATDDACSLLGASWFFVIFIGAAVWEKAKNKDAMSPFVFMALLLACDVFMACLDASKWPFVYATAVSAVLFVAWVRIERMDETK